MNVNCEYATNKSASFSVLSTTLLCNTKLSLPVEVRLVFDVGSGVTKSKKVLVDTENGKIIKTLQEQNINVPYQACISHSEDGKTLSRDCMQKGLSSMFELIGKYGPDISGFKNAGIATAWARDANNSAEYIDLLNSHGFNIRVVSQQQEGEIGYRSAESHYLPCDSEHRLAVVWDIGGGSYQLSAPEPDGRIYVHHGKYGSSNFKKEVNSELLYNEHSIPSDKFWSVDVVNAIRKFAYNHITKSIQADSHLQELMNGRCVDLIGIGQFLNNGIKGIFGQSNVVGSNKIEEVINSTYGISFEEAKHLFPTRQDKYIDATQTDLIMTKAIMEGLDKSFFIAVDAKSVDYVATNPEFWPKPINNDNYNVDDDVDPACLHHAGDGEATIFVAA